MYRGTGACRLLTIGRRLLGSAASRCRIGDDMAARENESTKAPSPDLGALPVLDASPNAVVAVGRSGLIAYANPRVHDTFGWTPDELIGVPIERLLPDRLAARHEQHRNAFLAHPAARPMGIGLDLAGRRRDGTEFPVEISLAAVASSDGPLVFATVVDITARKGLEDQLLHAQKMESIGRLAGGIAHDFNNMLFAIRGYAELLQDDLDAFPARSLDVPELRRSVAAIGTAADKASVLTARLLAFGRRQAVRPVAMNMRSAVGELETMLRRLIGEQVRLVLDLDPATGLVQADPGQLDQILVNLVVNARDAMPGGGTLTIQTSNVLFDEPYAVEHFEVQPGPYVMLAVQDTGVGMDRETRRHVFEPFFTTKEPGKGTGLGLATIYGIVKQAGGHIWLYSEPGRGSTFKVYFPQVETTVTVDQARPDEDRRPRAGTVLLVEDEPAVRAFSRKVLERAGYLVIAPEDPRDAQSLIEGGKRAIDVLVTDVVMPGVSGPELARRTLAARPQTAIVLLSGYSADDAEIADLVERGATFASKPLGTRDLLQVITDALQSAAKVS